MFTREERARAADAATRGAIGRAMTAYDLTAEQAARAAGLSPRTWRERKAEPGRFTLAEIRALYPVMHWTDAEIVGMIRGGHADADHDQH